MRKGNCKLFGVIVGALFLIKPAYSQIQAALPGSVLPGVVGQELTKQNVSAAPPVSQPSVTTTQQAPTGLSEEAKKITFKLNGIILRGNHVYTDAQLEQLYKHNLHKTITIAELFKIEQDITNYYRNNGYILSRALLPPQEVKTGVVTIQIVEGYIGSVTVTGKPYRAKYLVELYGKQIEKCRPLYLPRMERYLLLANEIPNVQVKAQLNPAKIQQGAADLVLITQNRALSAYFSYDNYGTRYIGPQQMTGSIALGSVIKSGDSTTFTMTKTPKGRELTYNDINYNMPIKDEGVRWLFGGTRTHTNPLFILAPAKIDGINYNYYTNLFFPYIRTRTESLTWRIGFNYLDSESTTIQNILLYRDHLRPLDLGATWYFSDSYYGTNTILGDFRYGLPILGYTSNTSLTAKTSRPGGRGRFTKIAAQANRIQYVNQTTWSLYGMLQGQWAFNPLLASEQFTFGGPQVGRGYDVAELIGDKGVAGTLELRYDKTFSRMNLKIQFYAFYDAGIIWNYLFIGGVPRQLSATSTGIGARFAFTKYLSGNLMWTQPLTKKVAAEELIGRGWRPRVFFSVVVNSY